MKTTSSSQFRKDIKQYIDAVDADQEPLTVTRSGSNEPVVVLPLSLYTSYAETDYLLRSPANAKHVLQSLTDAKAGKVTQRELQ